MKKIMLGLLLVLSNLSYGAQTDLYCHYDWSREVEDAIGILDIGYYQITSDNHVTGSISITTSIDENDKFFDLAIDKHLFLVASLEESPYTIFNFQPENGFARVTFESQGKQHERILICNEE